MANPNSPYSGGMSGENAGQSSASGGRADEIAGEAYDDDDAAQREQIEVGLEELRLRVAEAQDALQSLAGDVMEAGRQKAASVEDSVRRSIETQPYTAVLVAALVGFVIGSMNHGRRY